MNTFARNGVDQWGDDYELSVCDLGVIEFIVKDGGNEATHVYSPEQARKLAKHLKKAADASELWS